MQCIYWLIKGIQWVIVDNMGQVYVQPNIQDKELIYHIFVRYMKERRP